MIETILFYLLYTIVLLFGILLSYAFAGVQLSVARGRLSCLFTFLGCGALQLGMYCLLDEESVWKLYPLITHLPIVAVLCIFHRKRLTTVLAAVTSAYLCCQPANWAGIFTMALTESPAAEQIVQLIVLLGSGYISLRYVSPYLSRLLTKDLRSSCIFGSIPLIYYLFDYLTGIYASLWLDSTELTAEFIPFVLCVFFMFFCAMYYKEYEKKAEAQRKEQMVQIAIEQEHHQIDAVKRTAKELQILRHDMRLLLSGIAVSIENNQPENAMEMIRGYNTRIEETKLEQFCRFDFINAVLSDFQSKCQTDGVPFTYTIELDSLKVDELLLCSLLSNALDNALNAQTPLPREQQSIKLMLKNSDGKLLLSVKMPSIRRLPSWTAFRSPTGRAMASAPKAFATSPKNWRANISSSSRITPSPSASCYKTQPPVTDGLRNTKTSRGSDRSSGRIFFIGQCSAPSHGCRRRGCRYKGTDQSRW